LIVPDFGPDEQHEDGLKLGPTEVGLRLEIANESSLRSPERQLSRALISSKLFSPKNSSLPRVLLSGELSSPGSLSILGALLFSESFSSKLVFADVSRIPASPRLPSSELMFASR
jgi:hypothetical protein